MKTYLQNLFFAIFFGERRSSFFLVKFGFGKVSLSFFWRNSIWRNICFRNTLFGETCLANLLFLFWQICKPFRIYANTQIWRNIIYRGLYSSYGSLILSIKWHFYCRLTCIIVVIVGDSDPNAHII